MGSLYIKTDYKKIQQYCKSIDWLVDKIRKELDNGIRMSEIDLACHKPDCKDRTYTDKEGAKC